MLAFLYKIGFYLSRRPQKERLENFFSSQKICVCVLKKTYFFFAVFFFSAFFFAAIIYSPPSFTLYSDENKLFNFYFIYKFIYDKFLFVNKKITF